PLKPKNNKPKNNLTKCSEKGNISGTQSCRTSPRDSLFHGFLEVALVATPALQEYADGNASGLCFVSRSSVICWRGHESWPAGRAATADYPADHREPAGHAEREYSSSGPTEVRCRGRASESFHAAHVA